MFLKRNKDKGDVRGGSPERKETDEVQSVTAGDDMRIREGRVRRVGNCRYCAAGCMSCKWPEGGNEDMDAVDGSPWEEGGGVK